MKASITAYIIGAMVAGVVVGLILHAVMHDPAQLAGLTSAFSLVTDIFLRLIRMIIGPLVLSTLMLGIARMGDGASIGRVGLKALVLFIAASAVGLSIAMTIMTIFRPGDGLHLTDTAAVLDQTAQNNLTLQSFIARIFPTSVFDALARNEVLQIVVFSLFAGMGIAALPNARRERIIELLDTIASVVLKMTGYVMWVAPLAVFAAIAAAAAKQGYGVISTYAAFIAEFYLALALLWAILFAVGRAVVGGRMPLLARAIRTPALIAFSTTSSEGAYPILLANLETFGIPNRVASFVLPLGYAFNLVGSMVYCTMATMFAAEAFDIPLPPDQLALMAFLLFIASKGIAMAPRASLLVVIATIPYLHIPGAAFPLLLAIDQILDMGRTCTNTVANGIAATTIARWEGELKPADATEDFSAVVMQ